MKMKDRLVKCYKYKLVFRIWEKLEDDGTVIYESTCPHIVTHSERQHNPKCNGYDEFGKPCYFASWPRPNLRPESDQ